MQEHYVVGVDYGTLSGRAVVVRVSDGAELGTGVHAYPHAVLERSLPAHLAGVERPLPPEWALQVPEDYREVLRVAVPAAIAAAGIDPAHVVGIATDFTACTMVPTLADGTPLNEVDGLADRPHAYVKLWKHHAAQGQADRINELGRSPRRAVAAALRRADLLGVGVRQGPRAVRGGPRGLRPDGPLGRGGRLDRLAALRHLRPQRLHGRLQGHPAGRRLPVAGVPDRTVARLRGLRRRQARARDRPARRPRRHADRRGGRRGPGCPRASPSPSATSTRTSPHRRRRRSAPARWSRSWAPRPAT